MFLVLLVWGHFLDSPQAARSSFREVAERFERKEVSMIPKRPSQVAFVKPNSQGANSQRANAQHPNAQRGAVPPRPRKRPSVQLGHNHGNRADQQAASQAAFEDNDSACGRPRSCRARLLKYQAARAKARLSQIVAHSIRRKNKPRRTIVKSLFCRLAMPAAAQRLKTRLTPPRKAPREYTGPGGICKTNTLFGSTSRAPSRG